MTPKATKSKLEHFSKELKNVKINTPNLKQTKKLKTNSRIAKWQQYKARSQGVSLKFSQWRDRAEEKFLNRKMHGDKPPRVWLRVRKHRGPAPG